MFGSHLSTAGGMVNALNDAQRLTMDCVQVFTKSQRQWKAPPLKDEDRLVWTARLEELAWDWSRSGHRVVSHNSYLVNLASPNPELWEKSIAAQRIEMERCEALAIPLLVAHPGAHLSTPRKPGTPNRLGEAPSADELAGLQRIIAALDQLHAELPGYRTITCLETTVGAGTHLGYDFAHLKMIRSGVKNPERVAFCFDTCHVTAAGYDMTTPAKAKEVLEQFDAICGLKSILCMHLNDSVGTVGSRVDRHAHMGHGTCGKSCFEAVVNHGHLSAVPKILETPKEEDEQGREWDAVNLAWLRGLLKKPVANKPGPEAADKGVSRGRKAGR